MEYVHEERLDRLRGMLVGLSVGDAMGAPVEFLSPAMFEPVHGFREGGPHYLPAGYWTDDTSLALCTAVSLIQKNGHDSLDQMIRYSRWYREGFASSTGMAFGIGEQTRRAIELFEDHGLIYGELWQTMLQNPYGAGNGAIMRLAPVLIHYHHDSELAVRYASDNAFLTHPDSRCVETNQVFAQLILNVLNSPPGFDKSSLLSFDTLITLSIELGDELMAVLNGSFRYKNAEQLNTGGQVVNTLEAVLWAFYHASSFEEGLLALVNLGGDSDTLGAVYGQLAGAYWGYNAIPYEWRAGLFAEPVIRHLADCLCGYSSPQNVQLPDWLC